MLWKEMFAINIEDDDIQQPNNREGNINSDQAKDSLSVIVYHNNREQDGHAGEQDHVQPCERKEGKNLQYI